MALKRFGGLVLLRAALVSLSQALRVPEQARRQVCRSNWLAGSALEVMGTYSADEQ